MTLADTIQYSTISSTAEDIRNRNITSQKLVENILNVISVKNKNINAIVTIDRELVMKQAIESDELIRKGVYKGPLHGIPITIKDNYEVADMRSTASHKPLLNNIPTKDATVVKRLRDAGANILGKTNLPELAVDFQTNSPIFGRTNNPWDLSRTSGGSTGGGAAAVASGMSFLEIGNDLLGSIRIPAHFCGVCGFVPSVNTVSRTGIMPKMPSSESLSQLLRVGMISREVEDLKIAFNIIRGFDGIDMQTSAMELTEKTLNLDNLKIAWFDEIRGIPTSKDTKNELKTFINNIGSKNHTVKQIDSSILGFEEVNKIFARIFYSNIGINMTKIVRFAARFLGKNKYFDLNLKRYIEAEVLRNDLILDLENIFNDFDAIICPVTPTPAFTHIKPSKYIGTMPVYREKIQVDETSVNYNDGATAFTVLFSITGNPVVVIPIGKSEEGLPIGVQIIGRRWSDLSLLDIAKKLREYAKPIGNPN